MKRPDLMQYLGRSARVIVDRPVGYQHGSILYPINYGYIPGILGGDGEEQDAYILGVNKPLTEFEGRVIAVICRSNDREDKLVVAPVGSVYHQAQIREAVHFQERYFDTRIISIFEKSCGVLPYRVQNGKPEYLLVYEERAKCWSLPKGHMEMGETEEQTALRELFEETGLQAVLDTRRWVTIEYPISNATRKQVVFCLGEVTGVPHIRRGEIERYKWVTFDQLADHLYPNAAKACRELIT